MEAQAEHQSDNSCARGGSTGDYPPIADYAAIGDCRTVALISSRGSLEWLCLPHFSAPSVFAALLDRQRGGFFTVQPVGPFESTREYLGDTPILQTTFRTADGVLRLTDLMPVQGEERYAGELQPQREVLRRLEVLNGEVEVLVHYVPRPDYARRKVLLESRKAFGWACADRDALYLLNADIPLHSSDDGTELRARVRLRHGEQRFLSLSYVKSDIAVVAPLGADAEDRLRATERWWLAWAQRCNYDGPYRRHVIRSMITLKLLTYELSGAVVAAPTTSLPEAIGASRNWDYRYCWLRDASLALGAMMDLGYHTEGDAFFGWLLHTTRLSRPHLQVLYDVYGETNIPERVLDHLEGYRQSRPVRIGNRAHQQLQLDAYGSVILAAYDFATHGGHFNAAERRLLCGLGDVVCELWHLPDHGIWEIRGTPRHTTYSKLMCWVALDRLLRLHDLGKIRVRTERLRRERDLIAQAIDTRGYSGELHAYSGYFDEPVPDTSLLLMARYNYKPANDSRLRATYECVERSLTQEALVYRYPAGIDGLQGREGAFVIASFWAVDYLVRAGELEKARDHFEKLLRCCNDVGLYSEEFDPQTRLAIGNFPQAFSHVGLIIAALSLTQAERAGRIAA